MGVSVLIVDDEIDIQSSLSFALKDEGYEVFTASSPKEAEVILSESHIDIGLFDVWFPEGDGIDLLKKSQELFPDVSVVMMSGHGNIELALKSIRLGAYDFLEKPLELEKVLLVLKNAVQSQQLKDENARLLESILKKGQIIGHSSAIQAMKLDIEKDAKLNSPLVIFGENGSGRQLAARVLHQLSARRSKPFVVAPLPKSNSAHEQLGYLFGSEKGYAYDGSSPKSVRTIGALEAAGEGTLYVDSAAQWAVEVFDELKKVIDTGFYSRLGGQQKIRFESRLVFSLADSVSARASERSTFFAALRVLKVPSLRDRREDTIDLAMHFVQEFGAEIKSGAKVLFSSDLGEWLKSYDWPGNVRELKNLVERMLISNPQKSELGLGDLPEELQAVQVANEKDFSDVIHPGLFLSRVTGSLREWRSVFEKALIVSRLEKFDNNVTKTAESLGVERAHLHRKLKNYAIGSWRDDS